MAIKHVKCHFVTIIENQALKVDRQYMPLYACLLCLHSNFSPTDLYWPQNAHLRSSPCTISDQNFEYVAALKCHKSRIQSWTLSWFIVAENCCDFQNDHFRFKNTLFRSKSTLFESNNIRFSVADDFASRKSRLKLQKSTLVWLDSLSGMSRPTTVRSSKSELMM